jgi:hypothetical protein
MTGEEGRLHVPAGGHTDVFHKLLVASMTDFCNMYEFKNVWNVPSFPLRFCEGSLNL